MSQQPKLSRSPAPFLRRDITVAAACGVVAGLMVGAAYAAVPLYDWFCRTTGFAGTTQVAVDAPEKVLGRTLKVRFDANTVGGLPWRFKPDQTEIEIPIGKVTTIGYTVVNESARQTIGIASYNVSPPAAGIYFSKISCFCFTDQQLRPGETRDMPVVFFIDPSLANDPDLDKLDAITLSYTMYPVREPARPVANTPPAKRAGRS
jgi:cytochrome c oxidase assembly protein subunit 11